MEIQYKKKKANYRTLDKVERRELDVARLLGDLLCALNELARLVRPLVWIEAHCLSKLKMPCSNIE